MKYKQVTRDMKASMYCSTYSREIRYNKAVAVELRQSIFRRLYEKKKSIAMLNALIKVLR
jgi:hypothetical protein